MMRIATMCAWFGAGIFGAQLAYATLVLEPKSEIPAEGTPAPEVGVKRPLNDAPPGVASTAFSAQAGMAPATVGFDPVCKRQCENGIGKITFSLVGARSTGSACPAVPQQIYSCAPYRCDAQGYTCRAGCDTNDDCSPGYFCDASAGVCQNTPVAVASSSPAEAAEE